MVKIVDRSCPVFEVGINNMHGDVKPGAALASPPDTLPCDLAQGSRSTRQGWAMTSSGIAGPLGHNKAALFERIRCV